MTVLIAGRVAKVFIRSYENEVLFENFAISDLSIGERVEFTKFVFNRNFMAQCIYYLVIIYRLKDQQGVLYYSMSPRIN